jgi:transposase
MSAKKVYMAIDAHARHCTLGCMSARGEFQRSWTFNTGERELIRHVEGVDAGTKVLAIEEGPLTYWIAQTIRPYVKDVVIADPKKNPAISRNAQKGDKVDVRQLCRLLRLGELSRVYHPEDDDRAVFKAAVQQYIEFRKQESMLKHKIKAKFRGWGVQHIEGAHVYNPKKREEFLKCIGKDAVRHQLTRLYITLDTALEMQALALKECLQLGKGYPEIEQFKKIPGVGKIGALVYDAYIQTPERFTRKSQLHRYCKLGVVDRTSDGKPLGYKRLDRAGNSELKAMSYRAYLCAMRIQSPNEVRAFYEKSLRRSGSATHARLNTQRKILSVMHGVWRKGEEYNSEMFLGPDKITSGA